LFARTYRSPPADRIGWNHYVDGSIAFLRRDRRGLDAARQRLAASVNPANLHVLDGLQRGWRRPYGRASVCVLPTG